MFERFSAQARGVVVDAVAGSGPVTPTELLTALLTADRGIATEVLTESGVTLDAIRRAGAGSKGGDSKGGDSHNLDDDAEILKSIGIDLDAVRESLEQSFGEGVLDETPVPDGVDTSRKGRFGFPRSRFEKDSKKVLELSLREALAHKDNRIGAEHILLGILRVADGPTRQALETQVTMSVIRERLEAKMNRAA
ncbi:MULTISPECIES: Clp protease N-terminal domain-containing protein [unclassified Rhodococcus (in: high G+C Gram-positive bacteria)]|uniref:Clp protease N-terminal domain-containing protein n=1 Tax=unclassified Rhodococcus (in: high G+C Gram-positive bacteria) TaxID=192944 RepID=UPI001A246C90|nr:MULTISPECIES: Clp protease N-terminal domain-containing protein [unclassified Rhodococcus (in: high G+C Gram-positive bacteria)]MBJ7477977.1 ATP-dependent Clp protease ATP-binding subunit [Rhodococcus sp. (in: high G+C Gram-positive bacteria)]MDI9957439.1 Clp protease N-terminal domain-containing protein [Rhodococcus sp. IEGM 1237]MDI9962893.1 Clp protease N-terminal domain-containing protein [Rhodococcus sp. IEGM 1251]MDV8125209.1 Clp protease N-terminal domain-containing protein [Rhodococc